MYLNAFIASKGLQPNSAEARALEALVFHMRILKGSAQLDAGEQMAVRNNVTFSLNRCDDLDIPFSLQNSALAYAEDTAKDA